MRIGNYDVTRMIAEGGFARIYEAVHAHLGTKACIKQPRKNTEEYMDLLKAEAGIIWTLDDHHSIPHVKDLIELRKGMYVMVMKHIDGNTLDSMLGYGRRMHAEDACWISQRLLEALYHCHYHAVVHSDVKPGNVIVEEKKHDIKLIDFGLSVYKPTSMTKPVGYTEVFVAPEISAGGPPVPESDLYGAGLVMLYALGGDPIAKSFPDDIPRQLREFCYALLDDKPLKRPCWEKVNLVGKLSDIRKEVFGRRHTDLYNRTRLS